MDGDGGWGWVSAGFHELMRTQLWSKILSKAWQNYTSRYNRCTRCTLDAWFTTFLVGRVVVGGWVVGVLRENSVISAFNYDLVEVQSEPGNLYEICLRFAIASKNGSSSKNKS